MIGPLLRQEIEATFTVVARTDDELTFVCPEPGCGDKKGKRSLNLKTSLTFCWRCGKGSNGRGFFMAWARALGYRFTNEQDAIIHTSFENLLHPLKFDKTILPVVSAVKMPEGFTHLFDDPDCFYARLITRMARRKNLDYSDFEQASAGFTRMDPVWEPYCIYPVFEYRIPVYYQGRLYSEEPDMDSTKRFPSKKDLPYGARYWVYNIDEVREQEAEIVIVLESILNVLSMRRKLKELNVDNVVPVAVFKHHISTEQALKLAAIPSVKEACLLFDHDALDDSWDGAGRLVNRVSVTIASMPAGPDNKKLDPNDAVDLAWRAFEQRVPYTVETDLMHRLNHAHATWQGNGCRRLAGTVIDSGSFNQ